MAAANLLLVASEIRRLAIVIVVMLIIVVSRSDIGRGSAKYKPILMSAKWLY
jgi:hypothetical protein